MAIFLRLALRALASLALIVMPPIALGVEAEEPAEEEDAPRGIVAEVGVKVEYDDNIYTAKDDKVDSWITTERIRLQANSNPESYRLNLAYIGEFAQYSETPKDDYHDHRFSALGSVNLGEVARLSLSGVFMLGHQERGTGLSSGQSPSDEFFLPNPDKFESTRITSTLFIGRDEAPGRIRMRLSFRDLDFTNNRERTRFFSRDRLTFDAAYFQRIMTRTSLTLDGRLTDIAYEENRPQGVERDSLESRVRAGITWRATAKTTGSFRIGYLKKNFDVAELDDFSGATWELAVRYSPREYSHIDVYTSRGPDEPTDGITEYVDRRTYGLKWTQQWSQSWQTAISAEYRDDDFEGSPRTEETVNLGFQLQYKMSHSLTWTLEAALNDRASPLDRFEYNAHRVSLGVQLTL